MNRNNSAILDKDRELDRELKRSVRDTLAGKSPKSSKSSRERRSDLDTGTGAGTGTTSTVSVTATATDVLINNDWVECFDPKSKRVYYHSKSRKQSLWRPPPAFLEKQKLDNTTILDVMKEESYQKEKRIISDKHHEQKEYTKLEPATTSIKLTTRNRDMVSDGDTVDVVGTPDDLEGCVGDTNDTNDISDDASVASSYYDNSMYNLSAEQVRHIADEQRDSDVGEGLEERLVYSNGNGNGSTCLDTPIREQQQSQSQVPYRASTGTGRGTASRGGYSKSSPSIGGSQSVTGSQSQSIRHKSSSSSSASPSPYGHGTSISAPPSISNPGGTHTGGTYTGSASASVASSRNGYSQAHGRSRPGSASSISNKGNKGTGNTKGSTASTTANLGYADKFVLEQHKLYNRASSPAGRNIYTNKTKLQEYAHAQQMQQNGTVTGDGYGDTGGGYHDSNDNEYYNNSQSHEYEHVDDHGHGNDNVNGSDYDNEYDRANGGEGCVDDSISVLTSSTYVDDRGQTQTRLQDGAATGTGTNVRGNVNHRDKDRDRDREAVLVQQVGG